MCARQTDNVTNLEQLLDRLGEAEDGVERVSIDRIVKTIGRRSFGPLLLLAGVVTLSPLSGIPGLPSLMGVLVLLVAAQLLMRRRHFWLPAWLSRRTIPRNKLDTVLRWSRPPARWIDRVLRARLTFFTYEAGSYFVAVLCVAVAVGMPPMELVPFSVTIAGLTLTLFGLGLIAHDGLIALIGLIFAISAYGVLIWQLL